MPNVKVIDWEKIKAAYVMGLDSPSFDTISKSFKVSKPLLIAKANDLSDPMNAGLSWIDQRTRYFEKRQKATEDVAISEAKKNTRLMVSMVNNVSVRSYQLLLKELEFAQEQQAVAHKSGKSYNLSKIVRISDLTKLVEVMHKLSGADAVKSMLVKLQIAGENTDGAPTKISDLTEEQFEEMSQQINSGGLIVDSE